MEGRLTLESVDEGVEVLISPSNENQESKSVDHPKTTFSLSEDGARCLLDVMLTRGYFEINGKEPLLEYPVEKDTIDDMEEMRDFHTTSDEASLLKIHSDEGESFVTRNRLALNLSLHVHENGCRVSVSDAARVFKGTAEAQLMGAAALAPSLQIVAGGTILLYVPAYFDQSVSIVQQCLEDASGCLSVSDIALNTFGLSSDVVLPEIERRLDQMGASLVSLHGAKCLVTPEYQTKLRDDILEVFDELQEPTSVSSLCQNQNWDLSYIFPIVNGLVNGGGLEGELHVDSSASSGGGMYIPFIFEQRQREKADQLFSSKGYITALECRELRIPLSSMGTYMQTSFPNALVLQSSVINPNSVVTRLAMGLQSVIAEGSFMDVRLHVAEDILSDEDDARTLVDEIAMTKLRSSEKIVGRLLVSSNEYLFFSQAFIDRIQKSEMPSLIEEFAKSRAVELEKAMATTTSVEDSGDSEEAKPSKKSKSKRKAKRQNSNSVSKPKFDVGIVPLDSVAKLVAKKSPDLAYIQASYGPLLEEGSETLAWEIEEGEESGGPLYDFCRQVLYTKEFERICSEAVQAEYERLASIKQSAAVRGRREGAARTRNLEMAFADPSCFAAACYRLQLHRKFLDYVESCETVDRAIVAGMKHEFLTGFCSDFARRITQYALFKNELEDGLFGFEGGVFENSNTSELPYYCKPIDMTQRKIPTTVLVCLEQDDDETKDPLATLRVVLAGSQGVSIARMWTQLGGECFGGTRPGNIDTFMAFIEENCLTICGLPFKRLDKKAEKQYLFGRRQRLTSLLESSSNLADVFELTVMLLFQQLKGLGASGSQTLSATLDLLLQEKKMPEEVGGYLKDVSAKVETGESVTDDMIATVKRCGLSRDIAKHSIAT